MSQGYGYGNARLRAMRSRLLTRAQYSDLLSKASVEEVINALAPSAYKEDIDAALTRASGVRCVFEALRANLIRTLHRIRGFFQGEPLRLLDLVLRRWDRHNLQAILRGQSQELPAEAVLSTVVPVGQLDAVSLRELARQPGIQATIDLMTTWGLPYAEILRKARAPSGVAADLDQLELALGQFHYASILQELRHGNGSGAILADHLRSEIDIINLCTALRVARLPGLSSLLQSRYGAINVHSLFIESGAHVRAERLEGLIRGGVGVEGIVRGLLDTPYGRALERGWRRYQADEGGITVLQRELERWQAERAATLFRRAPLSIAVPIGYLSYKETEIANLRLIVQTAGFQMDRERVQRDLIIM